MVMTPVKPVATPMSLDTSLSMLNQLSILVPLLHDHPKGLTNFANKSGSTM